MKTMMLTSLLAVGLLSGCGTNNNDAVNSVSQGNNQQQTNLYSQNNTQGNSNGSYQDIQSVIKPGAKYEGKVVRIVDGDTAIVSIDGKNYTIRELDIDTPEVKDPNTPVEPWGPEASALAHKVLDNQAVTIEVSKKRTPLDKYHRLLAYIWVNGQLWENIVVSQGLGKVSYVYSPDTQYVNELYASQDKAKAKKLNIWSIPGYADPKVGYNMNVIKK